MLLLEAHDRLEELGVLVVCLKGKGAEARIPPGRDVEEHRDAARRITVGGIGAAVAVGLARHHHPDLDLAGPHLRRQHVHAVEHAAAAVQEVEREGAAALELDVDAEAVLNVAGVRRLADVTVAMDAGVDEHADIRAAIA